MSDVLAIAKSQKGTGETAGGVSKYGKWLDAQPPKTSVYSNADWCGAFQMWCIAQGGPEWSAAAGGVDKDFAYVQNWYDWMKAHGRISHTPAARRLVWYDWYGTPKGANHIGMVESVSGARMKVWEGNHNNKVELVTRSTTSQVMGYGEWWSHVAQPVAVGADGAWFLGGS